MQRPFAIVSLGTWPGPIDETPSNHKRTAVWSSPARGVITEDALEGISVLIVGNAWQDFNRRPKVSEFDLLAVLKRISRNLAQIDSRLQ